MGLSLRGPLFENSWLPVGGRKPFPPQNYEGTRDDGLARTKLAKGGENQAILLIPVGIVVRRTRQIVGQGMPKRGHRRMAERSGRSCKTIHRMAVIVELRIPRLQAWGVSKSSLQIQ